MNIFKKILTLVFALYAANVCAQNADKPFVSSGELSFYTDFAAFYAGEGNVVEFSLMIYADQLKLINRNENFISILKIRAVIKDENQNVISNKNWETEATFEKIDDLRTLVVYDKWQEGLKPGNYSINVMIEDSKSNKRGEVVSKLYVPILNDRDISLSQIMFTNGVAGEQNEIEFEKIPNPARRYGLLNPALNFYYEIYSSAQNVLSGLLIDYSIENSEGVVAKTISDVVIKDFSGSKGISHAIDVSKLSSGVYNFRIALKNPNGKLLASTERLFEIIQADYFTNTAFVTNQDSEILEKVLEYIATPDQLNIYKNLNGGGKAFFLVRFFKDLDPAPGTKENEFLLELFERFHYSNQKYSWGGVDGWRTERGRIFIQNGKPEEIELHNLSADTRPYEIWYYRKDREIFYVFADLKSDGRYVLIHSNKENEIYNPDWMELLK